MVHEHKRLGRGIDLATLVEELKAAGVGLEFLTGELQGSHDPSGVVFTVLAVGQRQDRGLTTAVPVVPPEPVGLVDEPLELRGRPAEPGGRTERERIGPRQVLDRRHGDPPQAGGHILRKPAPSDRRATVVELTDSGKALAEQIKHLWCALAKETVAGLPADTVAELPGLLTALTNNVDTRRSRRPQGDSAA